MSKIQPVTLPKWGLEMSEGTIVAWHLEVGATAPKGADLVDIETEKIVNTLDLESDGVLRRRLAEPGATLPVGALIAVLAPADVAEAEIEGFVARFRPIGEAAEPAAADTTESAPGEALPSAPAPVAAPEALSDEELKHRNAAAHASPMARRLADRLGIDLSALAGTGRGERISQADVEAAASALGKALPPRGGERAAPEPPAAPAVPEPAAPEPAAPPPPAAARPSAGGGEALAGPAARRLAREAGVDLRDVPPTGDKGRVSKSDVQGFAEARGAGPPAATTIPWTAMRRSIGNALVKARQTIPHFSAAADVALDECLALRARLNARPAATGRISLNVFMLKAAAMALAAVPEVNVHVGEDGVTAFARADIALAVAIEGGLVTPVVRDVGAKALPAIAAEAAALAERARARTLGAEDLRGATFTVSNLGMLGVRQFDAIINPPQAAILAVGATRREARESASGVVFASVATLTLSCDHRAVDGEVAARFLAALRDAIEDPLSLVL